MDSKNELLDDDPFPIDVDLIKKEEIEEQESFSVAEIVESIKVEKISVKEELCEDEVENYSSTNVLFQFELKLELFIIFCSKRYFRNHFNIHFCCVINYKIIIIFSGNAGNHKGMLCSP